MLRDERSAILGIILGADDDGFDNAWGREMLIGL